MNNYEESIMTRRTCLFILLALLCAAPLAAQARGGKGKAPDMISGTWKGEIVPSGAPRGLSLTFELKYDGKGQVSGTVAGLPNPADVKAGTFDAKTGALKLQLGIVGESAVLLVLEGTVANGAVSGKVTGEESGEFKLTKSNKR
jgi:hypothetical protein